MTSLVFGIVLLFSLIFLSFPCEGTVYGPLRGNILTFLPGSTGKIEWSYDGVTQIVSRTWFFKRSGETQENLLASIIGEGNPNIKNSTLFPEVEIEKPATLVLKNIGESYNGTYKFQISASGGGESEVIVFVAVTPMMMVECSNPATANINDDFTCTCKGQGGNPPADVTWYKGNERKGSTAKEKQILRISNVNKEDSGTYRCEAESQKDAKNSTEIELIVNYPPENVKLTLTRNGTLAQIACEADARPAPSFKIFLNETQLVITTDKTYTIPEVNKCYAGYYKCVAENILGDQYSLPQYLSPEVSLDKASSNDSNYRTEWYIVVVSLVSGIIIGVFLSYIASCSRRKLKPQSNPEPQTTQADATYQELDLTRMKTEDNYQPLILNASCTDPGHDDNSTYTELNKTRDVENNYQSLT